MMTNDVEQLLREALREQAEAAMRDVDVEAGLGRFRAVTGRSWGRRHRLDLALIAASVVVLLLAGAAGGAWLRSANRSPAGHPKPLPTSRVTIRTSGDEGTGQGTFTLASSAGAIDRGRYSRTGNLEGGITFTRLDGGLGGMVVVWVNQSLTAPSLEYAWSVVSATGGYAGLVGGGVATIRSSYGAVTAVYDLTGTVSRPNRRPGGVSAPGAWPAAGQVDIVIGGPSHLVSSPQGSTTFSLVSASGQSDTGEEQTVSTKLPRGGAIQIERVFTGNLGTLVIASTFGPASAVGVRHESWRIVHGTGVYASLSGGGTGTFTFRATTSPADWLLQGEEIRGNLTR